MFFSPHIKPNKPYPPREKIVESVVILEDSGNYQSFDIPKGASTVYIEADTDYDGIHVNISFYGKSEEIDNPNYEKEYKKYQEKLKKYKEDIKEWTKLKKEYDEAEAKKTLEHKRQLYEKLKEEFEG